MNLSEISLFREWLAVSMWSRLAQIADRIATGKWRKYDVLPWAKLNKKYKET